MNRLKKLLQQDPEPEPPDDYFEIVGKFHVFTVSRATAMQIERCLDELPTPRWIVFHDLAGAHHRVRADQISYISESTADQRAINRAFRKARREENKGDRPWDDDYE